MDLEPEAASVVGEAEDVIVGRPDEEAFYEVFILQALAA